jgi:hypothetical protein
MEGARKKERDKEDERKYERRGRMRDENFEGI